MVVAAPKSGSRKIWLPMVKSPLEIVAVKELAPVVLGARANLSELAVVELKVTGLVVREVKELIPEESTLKYLVVPPLLVILKISTEGEPVEVCATDRPVVAAPVGAIV